MTNFKKQNREIDQTKQPFWKRVFGDKEFIKSLLKLFIPAALQSLIAISVNYVDNFSLASLIQDDVSANAAKEALGLASPVINFVILTTIGWLSGTGVMLSQYFGNQEINNVRTTITFRIWTTMLLQMPFMLLMILLPGQLITVSSNINSGLSWEYAKIYIFYSAFTLIPFAFAYALSFSLQETKHSFFSFIAAAIGMATNVILDPLAIVFSPDTETAIMFVALSTGLARIVQVIILIIYIAYKKNPYLFFFKSWNTKFWQIKEILKNGIMIFLNDSIYSFANMFLMIMLLTYNPQIHDSTTNLMLIIQFTSVIWPGMATASSVLIGSELGAGNKKQAIINADRLMAWGMVLCTFLGIVLFSVATFVNPILSPAASHETNILSRNLQWLMSPILISQGIFSICYYALRAGGSKIVYLIDGCVMILWIILMASITYTHTAKNWNPLLYVFLLESNQIARMILGIIAYKRTEWARTLTKNELNALDNIREQLADGMVTGA
ncbi:MAG: MATE family efflux transporter [Mycoplasma sp.]